MTQIGLLALSSSSNSLFRDCFTRLRDLAVPLFSTEKLFSEVYGHYYFANSLIEKEGQNSSSAMAAALGDPPYDRSNAFLEGFVNWQAAGNPCDWQRYLFEIFGTINPMQENMRNSLQGWGIRIVDFQDWPGFIATDFTESDEYSKRIADKLFEWISNTDPDSSRDPYKKARPESESLLIVKKERAGLYHIISDPNVTSPCWFISDTSVLNIIGDDLIITWQSDSFVRYILSLALVDRDSTDTSFETILLGIAKSGLSLVSEEIITTVFGGIIDHAQISEHEQREKYDELIGTKYGEHPDDVIKRLSPRYQPLARIQLAEERAQMESQKRAKAEKDARESANQLKSLKKKYGSLQKFEKKHKERQTKHRQKLRKSKSRRKK